MTTLKIQPLAVDQTGDFYFNTVTANNLLVNTVNVYDSVVGANANIALLFSVNNYQNTTITNVNTYATSAYGQANIATTLAQAAFNYANTIISDTQIDPYARANANAALATANSAQSNTIIIQGVDNTQNTNITTANNAAWAAYAAGNTNATNIGFVNTFAASAFASANLAQANTIIIQGVDAAQNTRIQAAFDAANTAATSSIDGIARANANAALAQANVATVLAQAAFDKANTGGGAGTFTGGLVTGNTIFQQNLQANSGVTVANTAGFIQYTLPNYGGTPGQSLITDGYGRLQWTTLTAINGTGGGTSTGFPVVDLGYVWENPTTLFDMGTLV